MKDVYEVLRQKETAVANVRHEIQSLKFVSSRFSDELALKDAHELLWQKEADVARVRREIEYLKIAAPLLADELASDGLPKMGAGSAAQEARDRGDRSQATGTSGLFSSVTVNRGPMFWKLLKRKT